MMGETLGKWRSADAVIATSTRSTATLRAFVKSTNQLIGTLSNDGSGRFRGEFSWPVNPQNITVRSNFGGQATRTVTGNPFGPGQSSAAPQFVLYGSCDSQR